MSGPEPHRSLSDDDLLHVVGSVLDEDEPLPAGGIELAAGAFAWRDVDSKLAELLHDSRSDDAMILCDDTAVRLLVFQAGDLTLVVEHAPAQLIGAVTPPARYHIELQNAAGGAGVPVLTDGAGMFTLSDRVRGTVRFVVSDPGRQLSVRSPWITL